MRTREDITQQFSRGTTIMDVQDNLNILLEVLLDIREQNEGIKEALQTLVIAKAFLTPNEQTS